MGARGGSGSIGVSSGIEVRREPFLPEAPVDNAAGARIAPCPRSIYVDSSVSQQEKVSFLLAQSMAGLWRVSQSSPSMRG